MHLLILDSPLLIIPCERIYGLHAVDSGSRITDIRSGSDQWIDDFSENDSGNDGSHECNFGCRHNESDPRIFGSGNDGSEPDQINDLLDPVTTYRINAFLDLVMTDQITECFDLVTKDRNRM